MGWTFVRKTGKYVAELSDIHAFVVAQKRMPRCPVCHKEVSITLFVKAEDWEVAERTHICGARLVVFND